MAAANNNNLVDTDPLSSEESSDEEEDQPAFLNLPVNRGFNDLFEHFDDLFGRDELEEDEVFFGFDAELPAIGEFYWKTTSVDQVVHPFSPDAVPRPVNRTVPGEGKAIDYFKILLDDEYLLKICYFTNLNAARKINMNKHLGPWSELTLEELKAFIRVDIVIEKFWGDRLEGIWNTNDEYFLVEIPGIKKVFPRTRFYQIARYLHFTDEEKSITDRDNPNFDKLYKIRPFLNRIHRRFLEEYIPDKNLAVDETMVPFKGSLSIKQYYKDKPTKWGIKKWSCCDSKTGYLLNFEVYLGKEDVENERASLGLATRVVLDIVKPFYNKGYHVYTDRFYTSPILLHYLQHHKVYGCGTVMPNRKFSQRISQRERYNAEIASGDRITTVEW